MIKNRIIQVIEYKKIAKEEFYAKIGMTSASFRGNAKNTPLNSNAIENILSEIPDLNPMWLLTGQGEMLKKDSNSTNHSVIVGDNNKNAQSYIGGGAKRSNLNIANEPLADYGKPNQPHQIAFNQSENINESLKNDIEFLKREVDYVNALLKEKEQMLEEKERMIEEKERMIQILLKN